MMSRTAHFATEKLSAIRVFFGQYSGNSMTASIEYPSGTFTQLKFNGSVTGVPNTVSQIFSDYVAVNIPAGAQFWVRTWINGVSVVRYVTFRNLFLGEASTVSTTALTDQTMSGTVADDGGGNSAPPVGILGYTSNPSVTILGDSIAVGIGDTEDTSNTATGYNGKVGMFARSLGSTPFNNCAVGGSTVQSNANFIPMVNKGSTVLIHIGTNDLIIPRTAAQVTSDLIEYLHRTRAHQKVYLSLVIPRTTERGPPRRGRRSTRRHLKPIVKRSTMQ